MGSEATSVGSWEARPSRPAGRVGRKVLNPAILVIFTKIHEYVKAFFPFILMRKVSPSVKKTSNISQKTFC